MKVPMGSETYAEQANWVAMRYPVLPKDHPCYAATYDHAGHTWTFLGKGSARRAFLGPDGVVYKTTGEYLTGHFEREVELFTRHADKPWCPDWWPYPEQRVMAMKRYRRATKEEVDPEELTAIDDAFDGETIWNNLGIDPDDGHLVMLDGCFQDEYDRSLR